MNHNKVYFLENLPLLWEESSPSTWKECPLAVGHEALKLPPPPCPKKNPQASRQDLQIPLPPCPFQPPLRRASRKRLEREDPFLAAYIECTKNNTQAKFCNKNNNGNEHRAEKSMGAMFSCKLSCGVRDDSLIKIAHLSSSKQAVKDKELRTLDPWLKF